MPMVPEEQVEKPEQPRLWSETPSVLSSADTATSCVETEHVLLERIIVVIFYCILSMC